VRLNGPIICLIFIQFYDKVTNIYQWMFSEGKTPQPGKQEQIL